MATGNMQSTALLGTNDVSDVSAAATPATPGFRPHRITVDRYQRMVDCGIFTEKDPVFLWHGGLVERMTKGSRHTSSLNKAYKRLDRLMPEGWFVEQDGPVILGDDSAPEPDLKVVRGLIEDYETRLVTARDVALIVEVSDSSVAVDSGEVLETYACESIPVYWLVNIPKRRVEVYSQPSGSAKPHRYSQSEFYGPGAEIPVVLDGQIVGNIAVDDILPRNSE